MIQRDDGLWDVEMDGYALYRGLTYGAAKTLLDQLNSARVK